PGFLGANGFAYAGTWKVIGRDCDSYGAAPDPSKQPATWFWFATERDRLHRIMNVDPENDYKLAVLGAYYFANCSEFHHGGGAPLEELYASCKALTSPMGGPNPMVTLLDLQTAMMSPPAGAKQVHCTQAEIQRVMPGISHPKGHVTPPAWT